MKQKLSFKKFTMPIFPYKKRPCKLSFFKAFKWLAPQNPSIGSSIFLCSNKPLIQQIKKTKPAFSPYKKACPGENHQDKPLLAFLNRLTRSQIRTNKSCISLFLPLLNKLTRSQIPDLQANGPKSHLLLEFFCLFFLANTGCASLKWKTPKKQTKLEETASSEQAKPKSAQKNQRATAGAGSLTRNILEQIGEIARQRAGDIFQHTDRSKDFSHANYQGRTFDHNPFRFSEDKNISFRDTRGFNFYKANFERVVLWSVKPPGEFRRRIQDRSIYNYITFGFVRSNLTDASLKRVQAPMASFRETLMIGTNMKRAYLPYSLFEDAELTLATANKAKLWGGNFTNTIMPGAKFNQAELNGSLFRGKDLDMRWTEFMGADLRGYFQNEWAGGEIIGHRNVVPTDFQNVDLETMKQINFQGAVYNEYTLFPEGFDPEKAGMIYNDNHKTIPGRDVLKHKVFFRDDYRGKTHRVRVTYPPRKGMIREGIDDAIDFADDVADEIVDFFDPW